MGVCIKCERKLPASAFYYSRTRRWRMRSCLACNAKARVAYQRKQRIARSPTFSLRCRAATIKYACGFRSIIVADDLSDLLIELWAKQRGRCAYTGRRMAIGGYHRGDPYAATVDRIVPSRGYVRGNVALCCSIVNRMKQDLSLHRLRAWCTAFR